MGDGADIAIEEMMDFEEQRLLFRTGEMSYVEAYENGIIDELGGELTPKSFGTHCPKCGQEMHLVKGKYGKFYGCNAFPNCKGSRSA